MCQGAAEVGNSTRQCKSGAEGDSKAGRALTKIQQMKKKSTSGCWKPGSANSMVVTRQGHSDEGGPR